MTAVVPAGLTAVTGVAIAAAVMVLVTVLALLWRRGPRRSALEWDPHARREYLEHAESQDLHELLAMHNHRRAAAGLGPVSIDEYRVELNRRAANPPDG